MRGAATSAQTLAGSTQHVHTYVFGRMRRHMCACTRLEPSLSSTGSQMMWLLCEARIAGRMRSPPTSFLRPSRSHFFFFFCLPCFLPGCSQAVPAYKLNPQPQTIKRLSLQCVHPQRSLQLLWGWEISVNVTARPVASWIAVRKITHRQGTVEASFKG